MLSGSAALFSPSLGLPSNLQQFSGYPYISQSSGSQELQPSVLSGEHSDMGSLNELGKVAALRFTPAVAKHIHDRFETEGLITLEAVR